MPGPAGRGTWAQGGAGAGADVMTASQTTTFGALLRRYRLAASRSQEALAERAGLSVAAISSLERDRRTPQRAWRCTGRWASGPLRQRAELPGGHPARTGRL